MPVDNAWERPLVLLTGASGHAGKGIAAALSREYRVRGFDVRPAEGVDEMVVGSVDDFELCQEAVRGVSAVVVGHMAPRPQSYEPPFKAVDINIRGTFDIYEAAFEAGIKRMLLISSAAALPPGASGSESPADLHYGSPGDVYALTKMAQEMIASYFHRKHGMSTWMLRPCWIVRESDGMTKYQERQTAYSAELIDPLDLGEAALCCLRRPDPALEAFAVGQPDYLDTRDTMERLGWAPERRFEALREASR